MYIFILSYRFTEKLQIFLEQRWIYERKLRYNFIVLVFYKDNSMQPKNFLSVKTRLNFLVNSSFAITFRKKIGPNFKLSSYVPSWLNNNVTKDIPKTDIQFLIIQFFRFALVGVIGTSAHYIVLIVLVSGLKVHPVIGSTAGFIVGLVINYALNKAFTFSSSRAHKEAFWRFATVAIIGIIINSTAMAMLTMVLDIHYLLAQVMATILALSWNFLGSRYWVFNEQKICR